MRPWTLDDAPAFDRLWTGPQIRKYLWDDETISIERARETAAAGAGRFWVVLEKKTHALAGFREFRQNGVLPPRTLRRVG